MWHPLNNCAEWRIKPDGPAKHSRGGGGVGLQDGHTTAGRQGLTEWAVVGSFLAASKHFQTFFVAIFTSDIDLISVIFGC